ncbi:MAG: MBL fold metallo-hydrolase [Clostridia bacterium]|nr:MBL fold metallo-hydrolase [Clostridia bacterium]
MNAESFLRSVRLTKTPYGTAALWWMGQMGLWVKMGETVLSIDYFASDTEKRQIPPPVPAEQVRGIDAFLGTHDHLDHIDHEAWKTWAGTCPEALFVFPALHAEAVTADGIEPDRQRGMGESRTCQIGGVTVRAIAAAHEFLSPDPITGLYPCLQYIIEGNGVRLYHAGDTLRYEGMLAKLQAMGPIDAALLPINGRDGERYRRNCIGNMTFQEAADLTGELRPDLVIPGHWDMFADNPGDPAAFADYLGAKYPGIRCHVPAIQETILISRTDIRNSY